MFKSVSCIGIKLYYITNAMYIKTKFVCVCMRNAETTICSTKMAYINPPPPFHSFIPFSSHIPSKA